MKKFMKKIVSLMIVMLLCFAAVIPAFAGGNEKIRTCPKIYVPGIMSSLIHADVNDPDSEVVWPPSEEKILNAVKEIVLPLADIAVTKDFDRFGKNLSEVLDELFGPAFNGYNGEAQEGVRNIFKYPEPENVKTNSSFTFDYDWRADPLASAKELDDFISYVIECSGSDEVVLECHSLGGVITLAYLTLYGTEDIKSVMFNSTAIYGESYTGELFCGNIDVSDNAVKNYMEFAFDGTGLENFFSLLFDAITEAGVLGAVTDDVNRLVDGIYDEVMFSVVRLFANWPSIWAMVPDERLDEAEAFVFGEMYDKKGIDYSGLKEKIDNYNEKVRSNREATLNMVNDTANLYVVSRHGYSSFPLTAYWENNSDGIIDTANNSFGATVAKYNQTLDVPESEYVSPDKTVDASSCMFSEQTWFIEGLKHNDMPDCWDTLNETLLYYDGQATVDTFPEYPRFMEYDYETGTFIADKADGKISSSSVGKIIAALKEILTLLITKIGELFNK